MTLKALLTVEVAAEPGARPAQGQPATSDGGWLVTGVTVTARSGTVTLTRIVR
jgi:hypothetical protein